MSIELQAAMKLLGSHVSATVNVADAKAILADPKQRMSLRERLEATYAICRGEAEHKPEARAKRIGIALSLLVTDQIEHDDTAVAQEALDQLANLALSYPEQVSTTFTKSLGHTDMRPSAVPSETRRTRLNERTRTVPKAEPESNEPRAGGIPLSRLKELFKGAGGDANLSLALDRSMDAVTSDRIRGELRRDFDQLQSMIDLESLTTDPEVLGKLSVTCRQGAMSGQRDVDCGLWWLAGVLVNHVQTFCSGWSTNEPQFISDLMGYVSNYIHISRHDDDKTATLTEAISVLIELYLGLPTSFEIPVHAQWVRESLGLYLLIAGPKAVTPGRAEYDHRIHLAPESELRGSARGYRAASRSRRANAILRNVIMTSDEARGYAVALLTLSDWSLSNLTRILSIVFNQDDVFEDDLLQEWLRLSADLIQDSQRVNVVHNQWSSSDLEADQIALPDRLLAAAVASTLVENELVAVDSGFFANSRDPIYMVHNNHGLASVLKIDRSDKIESEARSFDRWVNLKLRPGSVPSHLIKAGFDFVGPSAGVTLGAVRSNYMSFPAAPETLQDVLCARDYGRAVSIIDGLFGDLLMTWRKDISRSPSNFRREYPVFRSAEDTTAPLRPYQWHETECEKIKYSIVNLGVDDGAVALSFAREFSLGFGGIFASQLLSSPSSVYATQVLECTCHGDLHAGNVLVGPSDGPSPLSLIDFDSVHRGHICKDPARLEASILVCVGETVEDSVLLAMPSNEDVDSAGLACIDDVIRSIRGHAQSVALSGYPLDEQEYLLALLGELLPMARYSSVSEEGRLRALTISDRVADHLRTAWSSVDGVL